MKESFDVKTIRETVSNQGFVIPSGSVIGTVLEFKHCYRGMWASQEGTYIVTVQKRDCEVLK